MEYELVCVAATSAPVITGSAVDACTAAGGVVTWVEVSSWLPDLTIAQGGVIATAIIGLWGLAYCIKLIQRQLWES